MQPIMQLVLFQLVLHQDMYIIHSQLYTYGWIWCRCFKLPKMLSCLGCPNLTSHQFSLLCGPKLLHNNGHDFIGICLPECLPNWEHYVTRDIKISFALTTCFCKVRSSIQIHYLQSVFGGYLEFEVNIR